MLEVKIIPFYLLVDRNLHFRPISAPDSTAASPCELECTTDFKDQKR